MRIISDSHAGTEFLNLAPDVAKKGIAGPASNEHDGEDRDDGQIYGHGGGGPEGMGPHFVGRVSESVFTDARDDGTNACEDLLRGDAEWFLHIRVDVCVDRSRRGSVQILMDPGADGGPPAADGAERRILGLVHGNGFVTLFILLEEESNGDTTVCQIGKS